MIPYNYIGLLKEITSLKYRFKSLFSLLNTCAHIYTTMGSDLRRAIIINSEPKKSPGGRIGGITEDLRGLISNVGISLLFRELHACQDELVQLKERLAGLPQANKIRNGFQDKLTLLLDTFQQFIANPTVISTLSLTETSAELYDDYEIVNSYSLAALQALAPDDAPPQGMEELTIYVPAEQIYREVVEKLAAIADIYDEVCNLAGVSSAAFPLRVSRIESGSLWLKLFGESKVIALITKLIENGASFTYRNFTQEGKLREIPRNIETIRAALKLLEELEQASIPTEQMRENIEKSSVVISDKINTLLSGSSEITVNEKSFGVKQELERLIQAHANVRLIEDGSQHQESDGEGDGPAQLLPADGEQEE